MAFGNHFHHKCIIERPLVVTDRLQNQVNEWPAEPYLRDVPCRLKVSQQRVADEVLGVAFITVYNLYLNAGVDVQPGDRIGAIELAPDEGSQDGPFMVAEILPRRAAGQRHKKVLLKEVS